MYLAAQILHTLSISLVLCPQSNLCTHSHLSSWVGLLSPVQPSDQKLSPHVQTLKSGTLGLLRGIIFICSPSPTHTLKSIFWQAQNPEPKIWLDFILPNHPTWPLTDVHDWNLVSAVKDQPYPLVMSPSPYLTFHFSNSMPPASQWDLHHSIYTTKV